MLNSYITEVLDTFHKDDLEAFRLFLASPYFNNTYHAEYLQALFAIMANAKKRNTLGALVKEKVYFQVFPDSQIIEGKFDKLISEMKKLLLQFLAIQQYQSADGDVRQGLDVLVQLRLRGLEERYFQHLEKIKKQTENVRVQTMSNYQAQLSTALEVHEWDSTYNKAKGDLNIPNVISHLDNYYFTERTVMLNLLLLQQKLTVLPASSVEPLSEDWQVPEKITEKNVLLLISWKIHELLKLPAPSTDQFRELLQILRTNESKVGRLHLVGYYAHLRNLCAILIDNGHYELRKVLHQIHLDNLERGHFYFDGKIPSNAFLNITQTALNIDALEWASDFVEQHKGRIIGENETHDFYLMNKALCLFAEKKFEAALDIIPFGSSYSFYHLMARRLELKIYYELDSDLLPYKIDAFKMFISRAGNKVLSDEFHELFANFINFLRQLSQAPKVRDKARAEKMVIRINEKQLVAERSWLLEKARELGERKK